MPEVSLVDGDSFIDHLLSTQPATAAGTPAPAAAGAAFTVKRFILAVLVERAATVVPRRDAMPVLKNLQITAEPGRLRVVASDGEMTMITATELVDVHTPGVACFPADKMRQILKESHEDDVHIRVTGLLAAITIGRTTWNLKLVTGVDFPRTPTVGDITFYSADRGEFAADLHAVRYAACTDANRANLMMIDITGGRMTAADSARLSQTTSVNLPFRLQIPIAAVDDLLKLLRASDAAAVDIGVCDSKQLIFFRVGSDVLITNKLIVAVPDLEAQWLRPALTNRHQLGAERAALLSAIRRVRINADPNTSAIALHIQPGRLVVAARDTIGNTAEEPVDAQWGGTERTLAVNHAYFTDMLTQHTGPTCTFLLGEDTPTRKAPILLRDADAGSTAVVQQMHLDW